MIFLRGRAEGGRVDIDAAGDLDEDGPRFRDAGEGGGASDDVADF